MTLQPYTLPRPRTFLGAEFGGQFSAPHLRFCTDNAAMIADAGLVRFSLGHSDDMSLAARPRWRLDETDPAMLGSGKKGAQA